MKTKIMMIVSLLLVLPMVSAISPVGNWWGRAYIAGEQVPDGISISAYINGSLVAETKVGSSLKSKYYELFIEGKNRDLITFKIGSVDAEQTAVYSDGAHPQLDLTLAAPACGEGICNGNESCGTCALDCGACSSTTSSSGGGGPSGGGGGDSCVPDYECRPISQCLPDGKQKEVCTDTKCNKGSYRQTVNCNYVSSGSSQTQGSETYETEEGYTGTVTPSSSETEEETVPEKTEKRGFTAITGAVIGLTKGNSEIVFSIILAIIIIALYSFYNYNKSKKSKGYFKIFDRW